MEFQEQSIGAVKLKTQCHSESVLIAMGAPPSKIWTLKGKIVFSMDGKKLYPRRPEVEAETGATILSRPRLLWKCL